MCKDCTTFSARPGVTRPVDSPDYADGGMAAAAIEKEAEQAADCGVELGEYICTREKGHSGHHIAATVALHHSVAAAWDSQPRVDWEAVAKFEEKRAEQAEERAGEVHDAIVALRNDVALMEDRALNAEKERDEALADAESLRRQLHDAQQDADMSRAEMESEQPHRLTPDAITDEARDRAYRAVAALSVCDWGDMSGVAKGRAMALVEAVIIEITRPEPSTRPEGAEGIEAVLREEWTFSDEDGGEDAFADLAERLASRGVRVATEEQP